MNKRKIEISKGFEDENRKEEEAFLKLSFEERFIRVCEISEIMLRMQYENGVLPKDDNFTLKRWPFWILMWINMKYKSGRDKDKVDVKELKHLRKKIKDLADQSHRVL